jgi:phosphate transport system protein
MPQRHIDQRLSQVDAQIEHLTNLVGRALELAVTGLANPRRELGTEARAIEAEVDQLDASLESDCQELMALNAPMAGDLRRLVVAMRITMLLEDIGDQAESVAKRGRYLARHHIVERPACLLELGTAVRAMYADVGVSIRNGDEATVKRVLAAKGQCSELGRAAIEAITAAIKANQEHVAEWSHLLRAVIRLRAIADLCKQIAEEAYFLHHRTVVRHHHENFPV